MPRDVAVIFVHGIQATNFQYSEAMRRRLVAALPRALRRHAKFRTVFWADIVRGRQKQYLEQVYTTSNVRDSKYRRFVVEGLGDAASYQKTRNRDNAAYFQIQQRITDTLYDADDAGDPERPLILIGHSLGCHIISSFIWDINRYKQMDDEELAEWDDEAVANSVGVLRGASPFRRLDTLAGFVTLGSNMPLFTFTFGPDRVFPITRYMNEKRRAAFPGVCLPEAVANKALWLNFYSKNDLLGFPLKPLNTAYYREERLIDKEVMAEGLVRAYCVPSAFSAINAIPAHLGYWTNRTVIRDTARLVRDIIEAS